MSSLSSRPISHWKKVKRSGNFKKKVRDNYKRILNLNVQRVNTTAQTTGRVDLGKLVYDSSSEHDEPITHSKEYNQYSESYYNTVESSDDEENTLELTEINKNIEANKKIKVWATTFNVSHSALRELFKIFNERIPNILPKDPRTLLNTAREINNLVKMENGYYWHHYSCYL